MTREDHNKESANAIRIFERGRSEAIDLLRAFRNGDAEAIERVRGAARDSEHVRRTQSSQDPDEAVIGHPYDAVQVIAHEQNRSSWAEMCIEAINQDALILEPDHPFIRAIVENDLAEVRHHLETDPGLANARVRGSAWNLDGTIYEAFADGPTKTADHDQRTTTPLHHTAAKKGKAALAQILIEYGADVTHWGIKPTATSRRRSDWPLGKAIWKP